MNGVNWWEQAIEKAWYLLIAAAAGVAWIVRRVYSHEDRLQSLEQAQDQRTQAIAALSTKIDVQNTKIDSQTATLMERIDNQAGETRADLRMITAELLKKVPGA